MCCAEQRRARIPLAAPLVLAMTACAAAPAPPLPALELCAKPQASPGRDLPVARTSSSATTYYVRTDGGNTKQCTGLADAPYPGHGDRQSCAWLSPQTALPANGPAAIKGGDTLQIGPGNYPIGDDGAMQAIPGGPDPATPTRVRGAPGTRPTLIGTGGIHRVLNLDGTSNVEVANLEITDGSDCVFRHSDPGVACKAGDAWARVGLYARASHNVWLHDLDIHGMAARGINAGGLRDWLVEDVKLNRNGSAGWDGKVEGDSRNSGRMVLRDIEIGWNGCGERIANREPWACWAQQSGGYGDGLGTTDTGGRWLVEDAHVHHNTSDGLDFRYMDGADDSQVTMRRVRAIANAGNQVKIRGNALIENSVLIGQCGYFRGRFFMKEDDLCRADGSTVQLVLTGHDTAVVRRNTIAGEGAVQIGHSEGDASDRIVVQDNIVVGYPYFRRPAVQSAFEGGKSPAKPRLSGNRGWQLRDCPGDTDCMHAPALTDMDLSSFDANLRTAADSAAGAVRCQPSGHP